METKNLSVADVYAGKSVFITGGTGFLGKVIIEKLLYSCPQIDKLYVLIREKRNLSVQQRFEKIIETPLFDRLRNQHPNQLAKIAPVTGDVLLPNLGLKPRDEEILLEKVSVVIHAAGTSKINEKIKFALSVNYEGTRKVLDLCRRMKKIQVFTYVSTAYTINRSEMLEEICPASMEFNDLQEILKNCSEENKSTFLCLCSRQNTHVLTKVLSESLVKEYLGDVPTVIVKPSLLTPSISEPVEGWVDNHFGATALLASIGRGYCRVILSQRQNVLDFIPVDYVSNLIIAAGAKCHTSKNIEVFNACTSSVNSITTGEMSDLFVKETVNNKSNVIPWPKVIMTQSRLVFWFVIFFLEIIPAYFADFCLIQFGNPPTFIKMQRKVSAVRSAMEFFTKNSWKMQNESTRSLFASLSPRDSELFPFEPSDISWPKYMATYFSGVKKYLSGGKSK